MIQGIELDEEVLKPRAEAIDNGGSRNGAAKRFDAAAPARWHYRTQADAVGLRALGLGPGMVDVFDCGIQLVFVTVVDAAELGAAVSQDLLQHDIVLLVEGEGR